MPLTPYTPQNVPKKFVGRDYELKELERIKNLDEAALIVVHGRRRIGKTALIEKSFQNRSLIKIEGLEGYSEPEQRQIALEQLARYTGNGLDAKIQAQSWRDVFELILPYVQSGIWTLYFEELQWLADYKDHFASDLKYYWDNFFAANPNLLIVLCGSSPSFMRQQIVKSKALYNRAMYEIGLHGFSLTETKEFLGPKTSPQFALESHLLLGGVPEYLKRIRGSSSVYLGICENSFRPRSFFSEEWDKIFVSSLGNKSGFRGIVNFLGRVRYASRQEIIDNTEVSDGGGASDYLEELVACGFIDAYAPYYISSDNAKLKRYCISDNYMRFFLKHIEAKLSAIRAGEFKDPENFSQILPISKFQQTLGLAFEFFCRKRHSLIAKLLGFGAINYHAGSYFRRNSQNNYQIDLIFKRADKVLSVCEVKYQSNPVSLQQSREFERKLEFLEIPKGHHIRRVLIAPGGVSEGVRSGPHFDDVIDDINSFF